VMLIQRCDFVDAVHYLQDRLADSAPS
jgi:hypothetical protein